MSYTSTDPEDYNRDPETSSLASTSTSTTSVSQQSTKKKKPWSKFKSSIKNIGEKMSARPKFTDPTESSEQKKVRKGKKGKASGNGEKSSTSTPEETPRAKSPTKNLMKKLSMDTPLMISTPFVGYQPASVSPAKSYAKALHKSGSTSESNLSASDIDTPKKSYTLDRNTKLTQESPDSGRASQAQGSLEGSRPPSQIKEVASDVSVDSDYTSPSRGGLDDLVTKTEAFALSLPPKKDSEVSVDFIKAETVVKPPTGVANQEKKEDKPEKAQDKSESPQGKAQNKSETPPDNVKEKKPVQVDEVKSSNDDGVDGRKRRGSDKGSKKEDSSFSLIDSERSSAKPANPVSSETKQAEIKDASKPNPSEKTQGPVSKPEQGINKDHSHEKKDSDSKTENLSKEGKDSEDTKTKTETKPEKSTDKDRSQEKKERDSKKDHSVGKESKENNDNDANLKPDETKPTPTTKDKKETAIKSDKPESKTEPKPEPDKKSGKTPVTAPKEPAKTTEPAKKEEPKPKTPQKSDDIETSALSKTAPKPKDEPPLPDLGATSPLSVEEKLQAFLSAEGYSGTIKDVPAKSADGSQQPDKRECLYKILVIGELGTGKTSIIKRYVHQFFSQHYRATIGVDFALKVLNWDQNTIIRLQLWDIAGQERFGNMTRVYYKEAVGAFIVFDVTRSATFDAVLKWKQDLDSKVQLADGSHIPCVLLANKCDQQKEGIVNTPAKMDEYCKENNFSAWFETSAKENINIDEAAKSLVTQILQNDKSSQNGRDSARDGGKFPLDGKSEQESKSCAC